MSERMIADLVSLAENALGQRVVGFRLSPNQKESSSGVLLFQDVENLRRPLRIRAVVEGDGDLVWAGAIAADPVGLWQRVHGLIADQAGGRVHGYFALPVFWRGFNIQNFAVTLHVHVLSRRHIGQPVRGGGI